MDVPGWVWALTILGLVGLVVFDLVVHVGKAHVPTLREAAVWSGAYVGVALLFGMGVLVFGAPEAGEQYFAGYVTEKALSVDNLFVFLIIMASFRVPREYQQKVLLFGIVFALIARSGFIFLGAALIDAFAWVFYFFGLILFFTAVNWFKPRRDEVSNEAGNVVIRMAQKVMRTSEHYDGDKLVTVVGGQRAMTPMLLVIVAIAGTDVLFAIDSIPAIFGLTQNVYVVFTATAFALIGLRQLYFLIDGLLHRLVYLSYGLAVILGFIGVKLILHALHENNIPLINGGKPVDVVEFRTDLSLVVIIGVLMVTVVASLVSRSGRAQIAVANARRHAIAYLDSKGTRNTAQRERIFAKLLRDHDQILDLDLQLARNEPDLMELLERADAEHAQAIR